MPQGLCIVWKLEYILWEWRNGLTCNTKVYYIEQMTIEPLNIKRIKFQNLNVSRLVLQLSLPYPLEPGIKSRIKSACRCCSNYICVIKNFVAYEGAFILEIWWYFISMIGGHQLSSTVCQLHETSNLRDLDLVYPNCFTKNLCEIANYADDNH